MPDQAKSVDERNLLKLKSLFRSNYGLPLDAVDVEGHPIGDSETDRASRPLCALLERHPDTCALCRAEHRRAIDSAFNLGEPYTFVCHAGLLVGCTPLMDGERRVGALFSGNTLPETFSEALASEYVARLRGFGIDEKAIADALKDHLFVPGDVLQKAGNFLFQTARQLLKLDMRSLSEQREQAQQQAQIAETIQAIKQGRAPQALNSYEREKELLAKVKAGDRYGAKAVLNQILGTFLFRDPAGSPMFKIRLVELLVLASRAAAEAGVDVEKVLARNLISIGKILQSSDHTELCVTISNALNEFLDIVCRRRDEQVRTPFSAVLACMEANFSRNLSVAELAKVAHLSPSRLSHAFSAHYGLSLVEMLTRIRIDQAKKLLLETNMSCLEIALDIGYQEQAYFTRMFRRLEKVTPRQYRVLNRARG